MVKPETSARRLVTGLAKIGLALRTQAWKKSEGLTPTQGQILAILSARPGRRLTEVAGALGVKPATASEAVGALARKGLLRKSADKGDGRAVELRLTRRGAMEAARAASWPDFLLSAAGSLSEREQGVLLRALTKMIRLLQERGQIPVSQMCVTCRFFQPYRYHSADRPHHCGFVNAPFGDVELRLDCRDHEAADRQTVAVNWKLFTTQEG